MKVNSIIMSEREKRNAALSQKAAEQGMALLKNTNNVLPIGKNGKLVLLGMGAVRTVRGGTGSGDPFNGGISGGGELDVDQSPRYHIHILDACEAAGYEVVSAGLLRGYAKDYDEEMKRTSLDPMGTFMYPEQALEENDLAAMCGESGLAVYVLSRNSGEGADRKMKKERLINGVSHEIGDFLLTETEIENLRKLKKHFEKTVVVLNIGGTIDLSPVIETGIDAILLMGQAGQEGGRALLNVLNGSTNPSGKLSGTWAKKYAHYPASQTFAGLNGNDEIAEYNEGIYVGYRYFDSFGIEPLFEFGYGLSYTSFEIKFKNAEILNGNINAKIEVENTGSCEGKEVVQIYYSAPESELEMPVQELAAFKKTAVLSPGEKQLLSLNFPISAIASFSEKHEGYIVSKGIYGFYGGNSSRNTKALFSLDIGETYVSDKLRIEYPLNRPLEELSRKGENSYALPGLNGCPLIKPAEKDLIKKDSPSPFFDEKVCTYTTDEAYRPVMPYEEVKLVEKRNIKLLDVVKGKASLEDLVAQMTPPQLAALNCGTGWGVADENNPVVGGSSESVPGAAGETTHSLEEEFGIPSIIVADGPAGVRVTQQFEATDVATGEKRTVNHYCTAWPTGTLLAQSFDTEILTAVGEGLAEELEELGISILLGPGVNIQRDPLCGRNFEYFSEDPLLSGKLTAAICKGIQSRPGIGACVKHFAANNQETNRYKVDVLVGQRALREIYLRSFEIAVKEAEPLSIMSSYNLINGTYAAESFDLCTDIARGEWGFKGLIMTDWNGGINPGKSMHAGNDLIMPGGSAKANSILMEMDVIEPEFDERGQVKMESIPPFPFFNSKWNSFTLNPEGKDTAAAPIGGGREVSVKDGLILVDGEVVYTQACGFAEMIKEKENFKPFKAALTSEMAKYDENSRAIIYRGDINRVKTACLGDLQRCAMNNLYVIMNSTAMKKMCD